MAQELTQIPQSIVITLVSPNVGESRMYMPRL